MAHRTALAAAALAGAMALPVAATSAADGQSLSLSYDGVLLVKVLDMRLQQRLDGGGYEASAKLKSYGVLSLFKRIDVDAEARGRLDDGAPRPALFQHVNRDGEFNRAVEVRWTGADVATKVSVPYPSPGAPAPTVQQKLSAADPLTQFTRIALTGPGRRPCGGDLTFFDGRQLYRLDFEPPAPREPSGRERELGLVQPIRCRFTFTEVAGFDPKPAGRQNQGLGHEPLTMDLAQLPATGRWLITAARGKTPLGEARIELKKIGRV